MDNFEQFKKDFKRDVLIKVIVNMRRGKTSRGQACDLARDILRAFSLETKRDVFEELLKVVRSDTRMLDIYIRRGNEFDQKEKVKNMEEIMIYLRSGSKGPAGPERSAHSSRSPFQFYSNTAHGANVGGHKKLYDSLSSSTISNEGGEN